METESPTEARRFVILAAPRTGSNWVCSMLNSHPQILCHHEIFNPLGIHYALDHRDGSLTIGTLEERDHAPREFLQRLWGQRFGKMAVGFKLNRGQCAAAFEAVLPDESVQKILLVRRNRIKTYVSEMIAEQTGQWESYSFSHASRRAIKLEVRIADLFKHEATNRRYYGEIESQLSATGQEYLKVAYENLESDGEWARMLEFLRVSPVVSYLRPGTRKQNPGDLRDLIANFGELEKLLSGSDLEGELHSRNL